MDAAPLPLDPGRRACLRALLDRLIPADDFPGAIEAGVEDYLARHWRGDGAAEAPALLEGLDRLDAEAASRHGPGALFAALPPEARDALLAELEAGRPAAAWPGLSAPEFFRRMADLAHEGFYADPGNGGNRGAVSWKMVRYEPRPAPAAAPP